MSGAAKSVAATARAETPDRAGAFPRLGPERIESLAAAGARRPTAIGEVLYREGDRTCGDFFVVTEGLVATVEGLDAAARVIGVHGPGRFLGELGLLTGQAMFLSAVVAEAGEVVAIPVRRLREIAAEDPALGDVVLRAYMARRDVLVEEGAGLRIVGSAFSPGTARLREFAARNRLPHRWIDLERDPDAESLLCHLGVSPGDTPLVIWGSRVLRNPDPRELARTLGLRSPVLADAVCDLIVVGAGPAGLAAAVYGASEGLATVVLESIAAGGQAATSARIENYLGFPAGLSGGELTERAVIQAEMFGAGIRVAAEVAGIEQAECGYRVQVGDGEEISGRSVIIASGMRYRTLPLAGRERFEAACIHHAATPAEAQLCAGEPVTVVGGGNSAGQAALFLAGRAAAVDLVVREARLDQHMSRYLVDRIERSPGIRVWLGCEVRELDGGSGLLESVTIVDNGTGERHTVPARALFVFIGAVPHTAWLDGALQLDERGHIVTGDAVDCADDGEPARRLPLETSLPAVFAAGDVRSGSIKRVASAVGEGAMAVQLVHQRLAQPQRTARRAV